MPYLIMSAPACIAITFFERSKSIRVSIKTSKHFSFFLILNNLKVKLLEFKVLKNFSK